MAKKLISLKTLLEEEDIKSKVDENDDEKVDEIDGGTGSDKDRPNVRESDDEKVDESDDEEKNESDDEKVDENDEQVDEDDVNSWLNFNSKKPGPVRTESGLGEPDEVKSKLDGEGKPGETVQTPDKLDNEGKPGETKQAAGGTTGDNKDRPNVRESEDPEKKDESDDEEKNESEDLEKKDEDEKEKLESEDDEDLLLLDESEDLEKKDEIDGGTGSDKDRPNVRESDDPEKKDESDDEEKNESDDDKRLDDDEKKVDEAVLERMLKALKVDEADVSTFKDILRSAINESVNRTTRKAVKKARSIIVKEANARILEASARKRKAIKQVNEISARAYARFEKAHEAELKKLSQFDEMVQLLKGVNSVMESFGLAMAPANKKLKIQLENARKAHARDVAALKTTNEKLVAEAERQKIRTSLERLAKTLTESERGEFIAIIGEMKVENHADFVKRATKVRDRLYKEGNSEYNNFVENFTESQELVNTSKAKPKVVTEERKPRNVMEATMEVLRGH